MFCSTLIKKIITMFFSLFPLQNKVVFDNFCGRGMGDDPKYIALALLRKKRRNIKLIWLCRNTKAVYPKGIVPVKYKGLRSFYELATAKVWIYNTKDGFKIFKRPGQFYIQTWHCSMGLKKIEKDANLSQDYQLYLKKDAAMTDLMYANNDFRIKLYKESFWYNGPVLKVSLPRLAPILDVQKSNAIKKNIHKLFGLNPDVKIILYAPTFRNDGNLSIYRFDYKKIIGIANQRLGGEHVLFLRLHPKLAAKKDIFSYNDFVLQASDYPDMQELLAAADMLISDYSSSVFDFGVTGKPVFLYVPDMEKYISDDRGLYFKPSELPFPIAQSENSLCENIFSFNIDHYKQLCNLFFDRIGYSDDGKGDDSIAEIVLKRVLC